MTCNSVWFYPSPIRRLLVCLLAIVFMLQSGCAALTPPATTHQTTLGRLAIISGTEQPEIDFRVFPQGKGEGAAQGAGSVFEVCIEGFTQSSCGDSCLAEVILMLPVCVVAAVVGGVGGAVMAPSAETVKEAGADLPVITYARAIQEPLRSQVATLALAYSVDLVSVSDERAYAAASAQD